MLQRRQNHLIKKVRQSKMRSVVLLSAGLDSSLNLYEAKTSSAVVLAITFDYGQRAAPNEIEFSKRLCSHLNVEHRVISLEWMSDFGTSSLVDRSKAIPTSEVRIDDLKVSQETAKSVWVPNRNGILLNIAAGFAETLNANWIVPGFNAEEAATFPDNSQEYVESLTHALRFSTANRVEVKCFTTNLRKSEIIERGIKLGMDFEMVWPCYFEGKTPCGECESCKRFVRAAVLNNVKTNWMK